MASWSKQLLAALGFPPDASDRAAVEAVALPLLGLGRFALDLSGASSADAARGVLLAHTEAAAQVQPLRGQVLTSPAMRDRTPDPGLDDAATSTLAAEMGVDEAVARQAREQVQAALRAQGRRS